MSYNTRSGNISLNPDQTKIFLNQIWSTLTSEEKNKLCEAGGYSDTRPFYYSRSTGKISRRMADSIIKVLGVDEKLLLGERQLPSNLFEEPIDIVNGNEGLPSDEESLKQYELLLQIKCYGSAQSIASKNQVINKIKAMIRDSL